MKIKIAEIEVSKEDLKASQTTSQALSNLIRNAFLLNDEAEEDEPKESEVTIEMKNYAEGEKE